MNHTLLSASIIATALAAVALPAAAQSAPASDWTVTGNAGLYSDYRFRGFSQTNKKPALQGGFDIGHKSGLYLGNWNSNVDAELYNGANLEMDFYGGYKGTQGDFSYDVGVLYYYYPGSGSKPDTLKLDHTEIYVAGGWGPFSLKYSYAVSDYFGIPDSKGAYYVDATVNYPVTKELSLVGHVGYQGGLEANARISEIGATGAPRTSFTDWKLGVTYDLSGWLLGAAYVDTNRSATGGTAAYDNRDISGSTLVLSIGKTF